MQWRPSPPLSGPFTAARSVALTMNGWFPVLSGLDVPIIIWSMLFQAAFGSQSLDMQGWVFKRGSFGPSFVFGVSLSCTYTGFPPKLMCKYVVTCTVQLMRGLIIPGSSTGSCCSTHGKQNTASYDILI